MAWIADAYARNKLEVGEHQRCPHCEKGGEVKFNACKKHKYVWAGWFEKVKGFILLWRAP